MYAAKYCLSVRRAIINKQGIFLIKVGLLVLQHLDLPSSAIEASFAIRPEFLAVLQHTRTT
jgi:hypothetical protein